MATPSVHYGASQASSSAQTEDYGEDFHLVETSWDAPLWTLGPRVWDPGVGAV
ncbi:MAG: hypothetical protein AAFX99_24480 [Myxococcota bacterium]